MLCAIEKDPYKSQNAVYGNFFGQMVSKNEKCRNGLPTVNVIATKLEDPRCFVRSAPVMMMKELIKMKGWHAFAFLLSKVTPKKAVRYIHTQMRMVLHIFQFNLAQQKYQNMSYTVKYSNHKIEHCFIFDSIHVRVVVYDAKASETRLLTILNVLLVEPNKMEDRRGIITGDSERSRTTNQRQVSVKGILYLYLLYFEY